MRSNRVSEPLHVVIVGGGVGALEAVLALHALADERVSVTVVAPEPDFVMRSLAVTSPGGRRHAGRLALADVLVEHGGRFVRNAVQAVDARRRTLTLVDGGRLEYDLLVLAHGASEVAVIEEAMTFVEHPEDVRGLLADVERGDSKAIAFVVPPGSTWPLPLYELALMTAEEGRTRGLDGVELHLITPEPEPLGGFGSEASAETAGLLAAAQITFHPGIDARVPRTGLIDLGAGRLLEVDRVVALPVLRGRRIDGVPADADGFIPVDDHGAVDGLDDVYAVGDATNRPIKHGGFACQQADAVAAQIALRAGATVDVAPLELFVHALWSTGDRPPRRGTDGAVTTTALPDPAARLTRAYLTPYLARKNDLPLALRGG